jgi:hypothetical protein
MRSRSAGNVDNQTRHIHAMSVIPLTIFFSLLLAGTFVVLFAREQLRRRFSSAERDSLLPLADETLHEVVRGLPRSRAPHDHDHDHDRDHNHDHDHDDATCGCRRGVRTPCAGCLRRLDAQDPVYF